MVSYEAFGGLRAIAWTDAVQGFVLVTGFTIMYIVQVIPKFVVQIYRILS